MNKTLISLLVLTAALGSCRGTDAWEIRVTNSASRPSVTIVSDSRAVTLAADSVKPGQWVIKGSSQKWQLADIEINNKLMTSLLVRNGERLKLTLDADTLSDVRGSKANQLLWQERGVTNITDDRLRAEAIEELVNREPSNPAALALMLQAYPLEGRLERADSLLHVLEPEGRPVTLASEFADRMQRMKVVDARANNTVTMRGSGTGADTTLTVSPVSNSYTVIVFTGSHPDASVFQLDSALESKLKTARKVDRVHVTLEGDTAQWTRSLKAMPDSLRDAWRHGWLPGGAGHQWARRLEVNSVPMVVVLDSTHTGLTNGTINSAAVKSPQRQPAALRDRPARQAR